MYNYNTLYRPMYNVGNKFNTIDKRFAYNCEWNASQNIPVDI